MIMKNDMIKIALVVVAVLGLVYLVMSQRENFKTKSAALDQHMELESSEVLPEIAEGQLLEERSERPDIEASELLPKDENTIWDQVNPKAGKGSVAFKNFLEAGNMFGVDTQGSSLRNANQSIRSEPIIKQMEVGPWSQSTIDPDTYRKPLESSCRQ